MSITISPAGNWDYVDANCPELIESETYDEECLYGPEPTVVKYYPFELNLSNGNFFSIFESLGFVGLDYCGEIDPGLLLQRIRDCKIGSLKSETVKDGNVIHCGRDLDYVSDRLFRLKQMAVEALKRNVMLTYA